MYDGIEGWTWVNLVSILWTLEYWFEYQNISQNEDSKLDEYQKLN